jgi:hypothetical protein
MSAIIESDGAAKPAEQLRKKDAEVQTEERPKPDPTAYGSLVDKMAATVAQWPSEYQRSVDIHHLAARPGYES